MMRTDNIIRVFSVDHVSRITGLTARQLTYWDREGFFRPSLTPTGPGGRPLRIYTFRDVVGLRVISVLLRDHHLSVQTLRRVADELVKISDTPWASLSLGVCKGEVAIINPRARRGVGVFSGQYLLVPIIDQIRHVEHAASELSRRTSSQIGATERRRNVAHNAEVFAGTRISVRTVRRFAEAGYDVDAIISEFPSLERGDVESLVNEARDRLAA